MLSFKEFYLQSSKATKVLPPRVSRSFKPHKMQDQILQRIRKLKAAKLRSRRMSAITR